MANLNKVFLIGRLTRDPEVRTFSNGGKVAKFGFAVNNRRKNPQTGQWEDEPVWLDCEAYNRGEFGKLAETVEKFLRKGSQVFLEGHLQLDQWTDRDNQKRQKLKIVVDSMQMLDRRGDIPGNGGQGRPATRGEAVVGPEENVPEGYDESPEFSDHPDDQDVPF
jgi:single-strand DNA-binding protein